MLSVNYISNFLDKNQKKIKDEYYDLDECEYKIEFKDLIQSKLNNINKSKKESYKDLYDCFDEYLEKDLFGVNKEINKNKNNIYTFFSALYGIGDESYYLFNEEEKIKCIKQLIHKMDNDLLIKNYYNEFRYDKNKYFNKEKLLQGLKDGFNLKVNEYFELIQKYTVDYLGINLLIFEVKNKDIINTYKMISNKYTENHNQYLPYYLIMKENDEFIPIMIKNKDNINYIEKEDKYKINEHIIKIKNHKYCQNNSEENKNIKKMKIDELREYCINNDINIYKISEKTGKQIKKTKDELLNEFN